MIPKPTGLFYFKDIRLIFKRRRQEWHTKITIFSYIPLFFILFSWGCRGDSQVLATYQNEEVTRGMLRDIVRWYRWEQGVRNILWQKFTVKQIALTNILFQKAKEAELHKSLKVKEFETFNRSKILYRLYVDSWRNKQEEIPEDIYETESIIIHEMPSLGQKGNKEDTLLKYTAELRKQIVSKEKDMSELAKTITQANGRARYIAPRYQPLAIMGDAYKTEIMKMTGADPDPGSMVSSPIKLGSAWQIVRLKKVSSTLKNELFDYLKKPQNEKQSSALLRSYWERILLHRTRNWKEKIFQKYSLNINQLPELSKNWQNNEFVFQNDKIALSKKDFLIFTNIMRELLQNAPNPDISDRDEQLFKDFLETNIFIQEAKIQGLHNSKELAKIFDWERRRFLSKKYIERNWFNDIKIDNKKLQRHYLEQKKKDQQKLVSKETLKKHLLASKKRKIIEQNENAILQKYGFTLLDDAFEQNFL